MELKHELQDLQHRCHRALRFSESAVAVANYRASHSKSTALFLEERHRNLAIIPESFMKMLEKAALQVAGLTRFSKPTTYPSKSFLL